MRETTAAIAVNFSVANIRRAQLVYLAGWTAEFAITIAVLAVAAERGGVVTAGLLLVVRYVPAALLSFVVAGIIDRWPLERILAWSTLIRVAVVGATALLLITHSPIIFVYIGFVVELAVGIPLRPVNSALVPSLCRTAKELTAVNVVRGLYDAISLTVGPAIAAALLYVEGPAAVLFVAAAVFFVSAWLAFRIKYEAVRASRHKQRLLREIQSGFSAIAGNPGARLLLMLTLCQTVVSGALHVFTLPVAVTLLHSGTPTIGWLNSAFGAGVLIGSFLTIALISSRKLSWWTWLALVFWGIPFVILGLVPSYVTALLMFAVMGLANAVWCVCLFTILQRVSSSQTLARIFYVLEGLILMGFALGSIIVPGLLQFTSIPTALIIVGCLCPIAVTIAIPALHRIFEHLRDQDDRISSLQRVSLLSWLPLASIEELAGNTQIRFFKDGEEVIRQGDEGHAFFVIRTGMVEVTGDRHAINRLGEGEYFGEIALLRNIPRTATVTAYGDLSLYVIEAQDFLAAISSFQNSLNAAQETVTQRLVTFRPSGVSI